MSSLDFSRYVFAQPYFGWLCRGMLMTLLIGASSAVIGTLLSLAVLSLNGAAGRIARAAGALYVLLFRNLPIVPLLLFLTFRSTSSYNPPET